MDWHIITSSKGGVGKTYLSLSLAKFCLQEVGATLVLDLNSMNRDSLRLVGVKGPGHTISYQDGIVINIQVANQNNNNLLVGYTDHPFHSINAESFPSLILKIRQSLPEISQKFGVQITSIIIDTSAHFAGLIQEAYINKTLELNNNVKFLPQYSRVYIWFFWVLQQMKTISESSNKNTINNSFHKIETQIMNTSATYAEMDNDFPKLFSMNGGSVIINHVINPFTIPIALPGAEGNKSQNRFWSRLIGIKKVNSDLIPLQKIAGSNSVPARRYVAMSTSLTMGLSNPMQNIQQAAAPQPQGDYLDVISRLPNIFANGRPINLYPVYRYCPSLAGYTDRAHINLANFDDSNGVSALYSQMFTTQRNFQNN